MNNKLKNEICTALTDGAVLFIEFEGKLIPRYTQESDYVMSVFGITHLAEKIVRTSEQPFSILTNKFTRGKQIAANKLGRHLINALNTNVPAVRSFFSTHEFNPYFELFFRHAQDRERKHAANPSIN